jgi:hypothetical protein
VEYFGVRGLLRKKNERYHCSGGPLWTRNGIKYKPKVSFANFDAPLAVPGPVGFWRSDGRELEVA